MMRHLAPNYLLKPANYDLLLSYPAEFERKPRASMGMRKRAANCAR